VSFLQNELLSYSGLQEGTNCIRVSAIGGGGLSIWASDFREEFPWSRSTFWWSLARFGHLLQLGRNIGPLSSSRMYQQPRGVGRSLVVGTLGLHIVFSLWRLILYWREHFVAAHIIYLWEPSEDYSRSVLYCIRFMFFHNKGQIYACVFHILNIVVILHVLSSSYMNLDWITETNLRPKHQ
jgi:hypothetical protein